MSFKEIIGQESAVTFLKTVYLSRRMAGAYMFVGPDGVGKKTVALEFAKLLVCENTQGRDEPCDECPACRKVKAFTHPDIQWVNPDGQFVKIDSIRQACRRLNLRGFESHQKVLVIPEAQCLNDESSNALLKTLEETPPDTVIILITPSLKNILPTIASRCQKVVFSSLSRDNMVEILQAKFGIAKDEAGYLALLADGSLARALTWHKDMLFERKNSIIKEALDARMRLDDFIDISRDDRVSRDKRIRETLDVLLSWFRDLLVARVSPEHYEFINADKKSDIMLFSKDLSLVDIELKIKAIAEALNEISHNVNARISLTKMRVDLWKQ